MDNNYLVDIQHERLSFFTPAGEVKALNDVSIHLKEGEVLGIVGESGSGKSVTAYSLMGLTAYPGKLIGGELHFNGHEVEKMTEKDFSKMRGKEVSIIFQDPLTSLNPVYTIGNQIMEVIRLHTDADKKKAYARAVELLSLVGINEPEKRMKQYPHELSGGMRQRVMIAIALACEPKLLIADEPTTALDVTIQAQILELMMELKDKLGMAIIMITHDLGIVASMCDRIAVMYAGRIVETGTCDEIFYHPKHEYTKGLLESIPRLDSTKHEKLIPIEGNPVDLDVVRRGFLKAANDYEYITMEGSGGILCPLCFDERKIQLEDVIREFELSSILVADAGLGTINSVVLTAEYMKVHSLPIKGIIFNHYHPGNIMEEDNIAMCQYMTGLPVIAKVQDNAKDLDIDADVLAEFYDEVKIK